MDYGALVKALSDGFSNPGIILDICLALVLWALYLGARATIVYIRINLDAGSAAKLLTSNRDPSELTASVESLKASPLRTRLQEDLNDITVIGDRRYRVPSIRDSYEYVTRAYVDARTLDAWPNIFVGIGLLLTFLGLALSLLNASIGAASGDIGVVKQSVTTLLEFSAAKFSTSLVALLCSILLGFLIRKQRGAMERRLHLVESALDRALPLLTLERIALHQMSAQYRQSEHNAQARAFAECLFDSPTARLVFQRLDELLGEAQEQTAQLTAFNSSLVIQLGEALDNKLQPMLKHLADRVETALRDMGGSIGERNHDALRELLEFFVNDLRNATKTDSAELQRNIQQLASELAQTSHDLSDRMQGVFTGFEATGVRFADVLTTAGNAFRDEIGRVQSEVGSGLAAALAAVNTAALQSSQESEQMLAKITAGASSFKESIQGGASSFADELGRGVRSIDTVVERLS